MKKPLRVIRSNTDWKKVKKKELINMIIDVIDLNFEILNFNRRYDPTRYRRGTSIYNKGLVTVENVNKVDEKTRGN